MSKQCIKVKDTEPSVNFSGIEPTKNAFFTETFSLIEDLGWLSLLLGISVCQYVILSIPPTPPPPLDSLRDVQVIQYFPKNELTIRMRMTMIMVMMMTMTMTTLTFTPRTNKYVYCCTEVFSLLWDNNKAKFFS